MSPERRGPPRNRRWRRVALVVGGGALVLALAVRFALPALVEAKLGAELESRGFTAARFELREIGLDRLEIGAVALPQAGLEIETVEIRYSVRGLWNNRIDSIELRGVEWRATGDNARTLEAAAVGGGDGPGWSLGRLEIRELAIEAELAGRLHRSRWSGSLTPTDRGLTGEIVGTALGRSIRVELGPTPEGVRAVATTAIGERHEASIELRSRERHGSTELALFASSPVVSEDSMKLAGVAVRGRATIRDGSVIGAGLTASADRLTLGRLTATDVELDLGRDGDRVPFELSGLLDIGGQLDGAGVVVEGAGPAVVWARGSIARDDDDWFAAIAQATVRATADAVATAGGRISDLVASLEGSGRIDATGADIAIAAGSSVVAGELEARARSLSATARQSNALRIELESPVVIEIGETWSVSAPRVALRCAEMKIAGPDVRGRASLALDLTAAIDSSGARIDAIAGRLRSSQIHAGGSRLERVDLAVSRGALVARAGEPTTAEVALRAAAPAALRGPVRGRLTHLALDVGVAVDGAGPAALSARASLSGNVQTASGSIGRLSARLPVRWRRDGPLTGRGWLEIADPTWKGRSLPGLSGAVLLAKEGWRFVGNAPISKSSSVSVEVLTRGFGATGARVAIAAPRAVIDSDEGVGRLLAELAGIAIDGPVGVDVELAVTPDGPRGRAALDLRDAEVVRGGVAFSGVRGRLELSDLLALRSPPDQLIRWRSVRLGERSLGLGSLRFQLLGRDRLAVARAAVRVGAGLIDTAPFSFDPRAPDLRIELGLMGIDLETWLPVISRGRIRGNGAIDGRLNVRVRSGPRLSLSIGTGHLVADGPGRLRFRDPELVDSMLRDFARADHNSTSLGRLVRHRLVASLVDFKYSELDLAFFDGADKPELQIHTRGRGHAVPQEVNLTVNVRGVEDLLNPTLRSWLESR